MTQRQIDDIYGTVYLVHWELARLVGHGCKVCEIFLRAIKLAVLCRLYFACLLYHAGERKSLSPCIDGRCPSPHDYRLCCERVSGRLACKATRHRLGCCCLVWCSAWHQVMNALYSDWFLSAAHSLKQSRDLVRAISKKVRRGPRQPAITTAFPALGSTARTQTDMVKSFAAVTSSQTMSSWSKRRASQPRKSLQLPALSGSLSHGPESLSLLFPAGDNKNSIIQSVVFRNRTT